MLVLGLESSCDETSIALLQNNSIIANKIYTQEVHSQYGGVVPEIASRAHIEKVDRLCTAVFEESGLKTTDVELIAVTDSPGLAGALLVGISFGLGLHTSYGIPVTGVNHLEGHILSVLLENSEITFPFLALVVSGGHTAIYRVDDYGCYIRLGQTIDDAAGEAFDKIGKLLGFPYPAGREIETQARSYQSEECIPFPVARLSTPGIDFSFSGLKTAVKYHLAEKDETYIKNNIPLICYSFQKTIITSLVNNMARAVEETGIERIALVGGVACNKTLREALAAQFDDRVYFPSPLLCTDNAAMIAKAGYERFKRNETRIPRMSPNSSF